MTFARRLCSFGIHQWTRWSKPFMRRELHWVGMFYEVPRAQALTVEKQSRACVCCGKYQERRT